MQPLVLRAFRLNDAFRGGCLVLEQAADTLKSSLDQFSHFLFDLAIPTAPVAFLLPLQQGFDALRPWPFFTVAALSLPCLERIVQHPVQPAADQGVADLEL